MHANKFDVIIIGAGMAGLTAANELSLKNYKVALLEARGYAGGRTYTYQGPEFSLPVETGAEFIHGSLPHTLDLLNQADAATTDSTGEFLKVKNGRFQEADFFGKDWEKLIEKLHTITQDESIGAVLDSNFSDSKWSQLRQNITAFVEGFDAADIYKVSALALKEEWSDQDSDNDKRIKNGYGKLCDFLKKKCKNQLAVFYFFHTVKKIIWKNNHVEVITASGEEFIAKQCLVTVPLGILQSAEKQTAAIQFYPEIDFLQRDIHQLGWGGVVKIILEFKSAFWQHSNDSKASRSKLNDLGFVFSNEIIPTWWTQSPDKIPILTGWIGGPDSIKFSDHINESILRTSIESLAAIFSIPANELEQLLKGHQIYNWNNDPFSMGGYSYPTVNGKQIIEKIRMGVENTIYFAGEAFYSGSAVGTVEAAIESGKYASNHFPELHLRSE